MTDKEKLEKIKCLADAMYNKMAYLTSDTRPIRQAMEDYHNFIVHEYHKDEQVDKPIDFEQELYKYFGQVKDFTLGMRIAKRFYDMGRFDAHIQDGDKVVTNEDGVRTNISRLHRIAKKQEPVSEDLKSEIQRWREHYIKVKESGFQIDLRDVEFIAEHFANWQKQQESIPSKDLAELVDTLSKRYPEVSFAKLSRIVVRVAKWQMTQMIKDATDVTVHVDAGDYPYIPQMELYDYDKDEPLAKKGDKYKVVLIKED